MNTNLITYDMENFLKKYTRFMTKDIYIDHILYENFLNQYNYLYEELEKNSILFRENIKYKKIINIKKNKNNLLKLHNQKYLKKAIQQYQSFFEELGYNKLLDTNKKAIVLSDEEKMLVVNNKNTKELIIGKIKYLIRYTKIPEEKILILTDNIDSSLKETLLDNELFKVTYQSVNYYKSNILKDEKIVSDKEKYSILFNYLTVKLFPDKDKFDKLYEAFNDNIYLNKDYRDFDTFKDYHNYIYKKVYLTSNLSLKKYNENEIEKRKNYLRTLNNVIMNNKEEVDIANFLYLNSIDYKYQDKVFIIQNNDKVSYISFEKKEDKNDNIYLEMKDLFGNNYVEKLVYELIKRRYPLGLISDEEVYNKLKDTTMNNYFNEFIKKSLIPALDYYDEHKSFVDTRFNKKQKEVLKDIYDYYKMSLRDNDLVTINDFRILLEKELSSYKYIIVDGDIKIKSRVKMLKIIDDYREELFLKENVKLLYDYKKYLMDNSRLPIKHVYTSFLEIEALTNEFKYEHLKELKIKEEVLKKEISIYFYEDNKRLLINKNISKLCLKIIKDNKLNKDNGSNKQFLIGIDNKKQIDNLILKNYFSKYDKNNVIDTNGNVIPYLEFNDIKSIYKKIILPFLISDPYRENLLLKDNMEEIEIMVYTILNNCYDKLIILCPESKKEKLKKTFKNIKFYN